VASNYILTEIARFDRQVTGVTVAEDGRIFVNFPRWTEDSTISVAEVTGEHTFTPYPDEAWNAWRNSRKNRMTAEDHWVCVQSVVADWRGNLWVLDPAAPATGAIVKGGPKLVRIDLATNEVAHVFSFDEDLAPQGSYLNDVRFSPDGRFAYLTDSGASGALIVVNIDDGSAWRVLDGHPTTQPEKDVVVHTDGVPLRRPDGRGAEFAADGIALSRDGEWLYWQALTGKTLYRLPTKALQNSRLSDDTIAGKIEVVGENGVSDGLWIDADGRMYVSALEEHAIKRRDADGGELITIIKDKRLRWPDTFSEGPDGSIYVTSSRIQDMAWYKPENGPSLETVLYRIDEVP
jgi:sugar lactone lactonase YvrE